MKVEQYISIAIACSALLLVSCKREERGFRVQPPAARAANSQTLSDLQPGSTTTPAGIRNEYEENAYALSEGKRLYSAYNCNGCHAQGGGGMGPPLMDGLWIYGGKPEQVFSTIVEGRPNGMPSFRQKVPEFQVWQLAAYVRSMSGQSPKDAAPSRDDHLQGKQPESSAKPQPVKQGKQ
ncbi:MAG TPA: c-type cytochrome [Pyrinomonadaceae bacterium]|jgi:cytochrome c oxidase cbb3-type subunit 3